MICTARNEQVVSSNTPMSMLPHSGYRQSLGCRLYLPTKAIWGWDVWGAVAILGCHCSKLNGSFSLMLGIATLQLGSILCTPPEPLQVSYWGLRLQISQCLLYENGDLSLIPQNLYKKAGCGSIFLYPSAGEVGLQLPRLWLPHAHIHTYCIRKCTLTHTHTRTHPLNKKAKPPNPIKEFFGQEVQMRSEHISPLPR